MRKPTTKRTGKLRNRIAARMHGHARCTSRKPSRADSRRRRACSDATRDAQDRFWSRCANRCWRRVPLPWQWRWWLLRAAPARLIAAPRRTCCTCQSRTIGTASAPSVPVAERTPRKTTTTNRGIGVQTADVAQKRHLADAKRQFVPRLTAQRSRRAGRRGARRSRGRANGRTPRSGSQAAFGAELVTARARTNHDGTLAVRIAAKRLLHIAR